MKYSYKLQAASQKQIQQQASRPTGSLYASMPLCLFAFMPLCLVAFMPRYHFIN
jgi:hypothetical protein